jgi:hypothetical protein
MIGWWWIPVPTADTGIDGGGDDESGGGSKCV